MVSFERLPNDIIELIYKKKHELEMVDILCEHLSNVKRHQRIKCNININERKRLAGYRSRSCFLSRERMYVRKLTERHMKPYSFFFNCNSWQLDDVTTPSKLKGFGFDFKSTFFYGSRIINLNKLSKYELQSLCDANYIKRTGTKSELIKRITSL